MRSPVRLDFVLVQAVIAGALSFAHLHDIAHAAGQDGWKAWAYPISVDLLLVAAWRRLRTGHTPRLAWSWFLVALVASLGANVATAGFLDLAHPPAWLRFLVAGWPALAFLGGTLLAHTPGTDEQPKTVPAVEIERDEPAHPQPVDTAPAREEPTSLPELAPAIAVPDALIAQARKIADSHRATTGEQIDANTLSARMRIPAPMAAAITTQLA
ncbi:DUF2637 domain-containing protein [Streptomyces sp. TRM66268-LWL]|uniref:DUF2637 domain-containing protein n=1 Tax=Streptomyces polyasparticus TaxID=2767826 RepID=A0ABR7SPP8_9ACTN|nr:DUF2637 domain-containing protein [Streptomyces polyasparticus]MBC9716894.1 DUF2637 domain-containing protein [Streptomyces polyasparticus]